MSQIVTTDDVKSLGSILFVGAHPDDETVNAGGLLAAAIANNQSVACIIATKGEAGVQDEDRWPASKLGSIREQELQAALKELGVHHCHWLGYADGGCEQISDDEGSKCIKDYIELYQPDTILTFGPDGMTGHPDHQAVSRWVTAAAKGTKTQVYHAVTEQSLYDDYLKKVDQQFNFFFNVDKPLVKPKADCDIAFKLEDKLCQVKRAALEAMPSQYESVLTKSPPDFVNKVFCLECFVEA